MLVTPGVKKYWIKMQAQRDYPVNAMGIRIQPENTDLLKRWRTEGIDRFMSNDPTIPGRSGNNRRARH